MKLTIFLVLSTFLSSTVYAKDVGKFTFLGQKQCAPFEGGLFDPTAMAIMIVKVEELQLECDLNLEYELDKFANSYKLQIDTLQIEYGVLGEKYELLQKSTDSQIEKLQKTLKNQSPKNNWAWFIGGVAAGIATTYGAYRTFNER
jgi:hypothetical protein